MKNWLNTLDKHSEQARVSLSAIIRLILIFSIAYAFYAGAWRILFINLLLLFLILLPYFLDKNLNLKIPVELEYLLFVFVIISFFLGRYRGLLIQGFFGIVVAFIGFTVMLIIYNNSKIKINYLFIAMVAFSFSVTLGVLAEIIKFYAKIIFGYQLILADYTFAMISITIVAIGALIASAIGYMYMHGYRFKFLSLLASRIKRKNPDFFIKRTDSPEEVIELIKEGEKEDIEFKSTLRINLHTGDTDKKIEMSVLKTIVAFLNTKGGTLLIGVNDNGEILGIEKDKFPSTDRFNLHFSNLFKDHIGNQCLPFLEVENILIEEKTLLKVVVKKSPKPIFLKYEKIEEFFIRNGPASVKLEGSKLIEYINQEFK